MKALLSTLAILALLAVSHPVSAEECGPKPCGGSLNCCARCGQKCACQLAVCRVERTTKKIKKPCFAVETEEFCVPEPQCPCNHSLLGVCSGSAPCDQCDSCGSGLLGWLVDQTHHKCIVPPKCGEVRCRKKLVVKDQECEVPAYKCKVEYLCPTCCSVNGATMVEEPTKPATKPDAKPATKPDQEVPPPPKAPLPPSTTPPQRQSFLLESTPWRD